MCQFRFCPSPHTPRLCQNYRVLGHPLQVLCHHFPPRHLLRQPSSWHLLSHKRQGLYSCVWPPLPSFKGPFSVGLSRETKEIWLFSHTHSGPQETGKTFEVYLLDTLLSHFYSSAPGLCWAPSWQMSLVPSALKCLSNLSRAQPVWEKGTRFLLRNPPVSPHIPSPVPGTGTIHLMGRRV